MAATPATPHNPRNQEASISDVNTTAGSTEAAAPERPRPEYGEYATPAEQAEAMGLTPVELAQLTTLTPAAKPVAEPAEVATAAVSKDKSGELAPPAASDAIPLPPPSKTPDLQTGARRWDLPITYGLLFYGAFTVFSTVVDARAYGSSLQAMFTQFVGKDSFSAVDLANDLGPWIAAAHGVIFVITVALTVVSIRRKRVSFYIPLLGAVAAGIVTMIFSAVIVANDPTLMAFIQSRQ